MAEFMKRSWRRMSAAARVLVLMCMGVVAVSLAVLFALASDEASDADHDGLTDLDEAALGTDTLSPDTDRDGWRDSEDQAPVSRMWIGADPRFVDGDELLYAFWPAWSVGAFKIGGEWITNETSHWHVQASETNEASLNIEVDRLLLTNSAVLKLNLLDAPDAVLQLDFYDTNGQAVAEDLYGNLLTGSNEVETLFITIPFETHPTAAGIRLKRVSGEVTIYDALLYVDEDGDGLDVEQERQLGTSDNHPLAEGSPEPTISPVGTSAGDTSASSTGAIASASIGTATNMPPDAAISEHGKIVFVDQLEGEDSYPGTSDLPKKTVNAGLDAGNPGGTVFVRSGQYLEDVNLVGRDVRVVVKGNVKISGKIEAELPGLNMSNSVPISVVTNAP